MSRADEFRRMLLHAAKRLQEEDESVVAKFAVAHTKAVEDPDGWKRRNHSIAIAKDLASYQTATTYACLVMELVASFLVDEPVAEETQP